MLHWTISHYFRMIELLEKAEGRTPSPSTCFPGVRTSWQQTTAQCNIGRYSWRNCQWRKATWNLSAEQQSFKCQKGKEEGSVRGEKWATRSSTCSLIPAGRYRAWWVAYFYPKMDWNKRPTYITLDYLSAYPVTNDIRSYPQPPLNKNGGIPPAALHPKGAKYPPFVPLVFVKNWSNPVYFHFELRKEVAPDCNFAISNISHRIILSAPIWIFCMFVCKNHIIFFLLFSLRIKIKLANRSIGFYAKA